MGAHARTTLEEALLTQGGRGQEYEKKDTERSFVKIAQAHNAIAGKGLDGDDIALVLTLLKLVRQRTARDNGIYHRDSGVDGTSYAALLDEETFLYLQASANSETQHG